MIAKKATPKRVQYPLHQSPFFKLSNKRKLASILVIPLEKLLALSYEKDKNYRIFKVKKSTPKERIVEQPKPFLAIVHKRILNLFRRVEIPNYLHSATKGRSYITNASYHMGDHKAIRIDIKKFYPSVKRDKVFNFFRKKMQCSEDIAVILSNICTCNDHLPTGSSLSPLLSYFVNKDMFDQINKLACDNNLNMSCYVDDIVVSGSSADGKICFEIQKIIDSFGYRYHKKKILRKSSSKSITGVIVKKDRIEVPYSRLRKIREIREDLSKEKDDEKKNFLLRKLLGCYTEAAQMEDKYESFAKGVLAEIRFHRNKR